MKDGIVVAHLLHEIVPSSCNVEEIVSEKDPLKRAELIMESVTKLNIPKLVISEELTKDSKSNIMLVASLFDSYPCLEMDQLTEIKEEITVDDEGTREERAFRFWINSLGIPVRNLSEDVKDGIVILKIFDEIEPGIVQWTKVNLIPSNAYKKIENCNYCIELAHRLKFSIVGIGGKDFYEGNRKLILALIWQCMRYHIISLLNRLKFKGKEVTEKDMIQWANQKVAEAGKKSEMKSFKDPSLKDAKFLIDLLAVIRPNAVDNSFVKSGKTEEECMMNAKYAISVARKIGCTIFLLWEDIVEVRSKMILTFIGALMSLDSH